MVAQAIYERLGVPTMINAHGTLTRWGGSRMAAEVTAAMVEAAGSFVDLEELLHKSGEHVARLLGVEGAYIAAGAAAGLALSAAACMTGTDRAAIEQLPDTRGLRRRIAIHRCHRNGYDHGLRQTGAELVEFGYIKETYTWQLEAALDSETAAVAFFEEFNARGSLPLATVVEIAHARGIPVINDASAEVPPASNLTRYSAEGADLVIFSGGKDIAGPQNSGLILGRRDLLAACALNANPNYGIGRSMKVTKEAVAGLVVALERYLARDEAALEKRWEAQVAYWVETLSEVPGLRAHRVSPVAPGIQPTWIPRAYVEWDEGALDLTVEDARHALRMGEPGVLVGLAPGALVLNPQVVDPGEERIVAERVAAVCWRRP